MDWAKGGKLGAGGMRPAAGKVALVEGFGWDWTGGIGTEAGVKRFSSKAVAVHVIMIKNRTKKLDEKFGRSNSSFIIRYKDYR